MGPLDSAAIAFSSNHYALDSADCPVVDLIACEWGDFRVPVPILGVYGSFFQVIKSNASQC